MTIQEHKKEVSKLKDIEVDLIKLISNTDNQELMDKFIEWMDQRNVCNEGFCNIVENIK